MEPTIPAGSFMIGTRITGELECGDIVIFKRYGVYLVKRVVAMPGDIVYVNMESHEVSIANDSEQSVQKQLSLRTAVFS